MGMITRAQAFLQRFLPRWLAGEDLRCQQYAFLRILDTAYRQGHDPKPLIEKPVAGIARLLRKKTQIGAALASR